VLVGEPELGRAAVHFFGDDARDHAGVGHLQQHLRDPLLHVFGNASKNDRSPVLWTLVRRDRQALEFFLQLCPAKQVRQWRTQVVEVLDLCLLRHLIASGIKPGGLSVDHEQFLARLFVLPTHPTRASQPQRA
jgi:hypothetical protein